MIIPNEDQIKADNLANKEVDEGEDTVNSSRAVYQFTGELDELSRNDLNDAIAALALDYGLRLVEL